eukprot:9109-Rhodomonas_salina.1
MSSLFDSPSRVQMDPPGTDCAGGMRLSERQLAMQGWFSSVAMCTESSEQYDAAVEQRSDGYW